mgnify:CR=1 FL=1
MASIRGIDVSSNQPADICSLVDYDFAIVKATGNPPGYAWNYKNPYMEEQVGDALDKTGCAGLYHFTFGRAAKEEADFFCDSVADYVGRVMLVIDYEGQATDNGREWLREFAQRIIYRTGVKPVVYASSSVIRDQDLEALAEEEDLSLWSANYWRGYDTVYGYDTSGMKQDIPSSALWQFTSQGVLDGYDGFLDLDLFYGDADTWQKYCVSDKEEPEEPKEEDMTNDQDSKLNAIYDACAGWLQGVYAEVMRTDDPTGRGYEMRDHDHLKWVAKQTHDNGDAISALSGRIDQLEIKLDKILSIVTSD